MFSNQKTISIREFGFGFDQAIPTRKAFSGPPEERKIPARHFVV
jgi:hypothetical protein